MKSLLRLDNSSTVPNFLGATNQTERLESTITYPLWFGVAAVVPQQPPPALPQVILELNNEHVDVEERSLPELDGVMILTQDDDVTNYHMDDNNARALPLDDRVDDSATGTQLRGPTSRALFA